MSKDYDPQSDLQAWLAYRKTVKPLKGAIESIDFTMEMHFCETPLAPVFAPTTHKHLVPDTPTRLTSKRLDLHGFTQNEAYNALLSFIFSANQSKFREVVIITGKGRDDPDRYFASLGVLKKQVPRWLNEKPFNQYVRRIDPAPLNKGGAGAIVVKLNH